MKSCLGFNERAWVVDPKSAPRRAAVSTALDDIWWDRVIFTVAVFAGYITDPADPSAVVEASVHTGGYARCASRAERVGKAAAARSDSYEKGEEEKSAGLSLSLKMRSL